jgi:ribonuclease P protein component
VPNFPRAHRLVSKTQYDAVYQDSRRLGDSFFLVLARPNTTSQARLGLSVSVRSVGNAVNRNRIKRIIRDCFRLNSTALPAVDLVVNTRPAARDATNTQLRTSLEMHWTNVVKRCGAR